VADPDPRVRAGGLALDHLAQKAEEARKQILESLRTILGAQPGESLESRARVVMERLRVGTPQDFRCEVLADTIKTDVRQDSTETLR